MKLSNNKNKHEDYYTRRARKENYPARSVYKLQEIQQRYKVIKKGDQVLDLGCAPGAWLLYAGELTGKNGQIMGLDLKPVTIKLPVHTVAMTGDIFDTDVIQKKKFTVVLSDLAPKTSGHKGVDATRSIVLCERALEIACHVLVPGGNFVCKIFQGQGIDTFIAQVKAEFKFQKLFKPKTCRKKSKEIYIVGKDYKILNPK